MALMPKATMELDWVMSPEAIALLLAWVHYPKQSRRDAMAMIDHAATMARQAMNSPGASSRVANALDLVSGLLRALE